MPSEAGDRKLDTRRDFLAQQGELARDELRVPFVTPPFDYRKNDSNVSLATFHPTLQRGRSLLWSHEPLTRRARPPRAVSDDKLGSRCVMTYVVVTMSETGEAINLRDSR